MRQTSNINKNNLQSAGFPALFGAIPFVPGQAGVNKEWLRDTLIIGWFRSLRRWKSTMKLFACRRDRQVQSGEFTVHSVIDD